MNTYVTARQVAIHSGVHVGNGFECYTGCGHCSGVCSNVNILLDDSDEDVHDD